MTSERHKQNSNKILTVIHCDMRVPDAGVETEDCAGRAGDRLVMLVGQMAMMLMTLVGDKDVVELEQLTMEGGRAGHSWYSRDLVTGTGTRQMETVEGELGMVQVAMAVVEIGAWQWS